MNEPPADPVADVQTLLAELGSVLASVRAQHRALAAVPDPEGACEQALRQLQGRRKQLTQDLGPALVRLLAHGGTLVMPRQVPAAQREPEPPLVPPDPARALVAVERAVQDPSADLGARVLQAVQAGIGQRHPRLLLALRGQLHRLGHMPGLETLKSALMSASRPDPIEEELLEEASTLELAKEWPHLGLTEGKRAALVGGDPRPAATERIRAAFRFSRVDWESQDVRRMRVLADRVRGRSVDLVLLLRALEAHAETSTVLQACRDSEVPWVMVEAGYGVNQVRLALERFVESR
jgi:hypothetical protein